MRKNLPDGPGESVMKILSTGSVTSAKHVRSKLGRSQLGGLPREVGFLT
jgi:hypothetical protein